MKAKKECLVFDFSFWGRWVVVFFALCVFLMWLRFAGQPITEAFSFRQTQTALTSLWFDWSNPIRGFFFYETPVLGAPWRVPFEFPFYQGLVAGVSWLTGFSLSGVGRMVSGALFLLSFFPLKGWFRCLGFGEKAFFFTAVLLLSSPLYLFWSRSFLIESTAFFFGFCFLWATARAMGCGESRKKSIFWWLLAVFLGVLCGLVKATTLPSFLVAAAGSVFLVVRGRSVEKKKQWFDLLLTLLFAGICVGVVLLWTQHADACKRGNPIAAHLVSKNLETWNYGTWETKFGKPFWSETIGGRVIPETVGSIWVLLVPCVALVFASWKERAILAFFGFLFLFPMVLFANLHMVHRYYQYANAFWLVLAVGFGFFVLEKRGGLQIFAVLALVVVVGWGRFSEEFYPTMRWWETSIPQKEVGEFLDAKLGKDEVVLILGDDWSPEIAFFCRRRTLYIPSWSGDFFPVDEEFLIDAIWNPEKYLGGKPLGAIVVRLPDPNVAEFPVKRAAAWAEKKKNTAKKEVKFPKYEVYLVEKESGAL